MKRLVSKWEKLISKNTEFSHKDVKNLFPDCSPRTIIHWVESGLIKPLRNSNGRGTRRLYTIKNIIEMYFVQQLMLRGIPLPVMKEIMSLNLLWDALKKENNFVWFDWKGRKLQWATSDIECHDRGGFLMGVDLVVLMLSVVVRVGEYKQNREVTE